MDQGVVGGDRDGLRLHGARGDGAPDQAFEHDGRAAHGVVPIHVAIHLVLGEQQRLERRQPFFVECERGTPIEPRRDG